MTEAAASVATALIALAFTSVVIPLGAVLLVRLFQEHAS